MNKTGPGGIFFSLPQEIRDEIYRYLVKGHYLFYQSPGDWTSTIPKAVLKTSIDSPSFTIFQVSKATYHEATLIFYSESIFRYSLDQIHSPITYTPGPAKNRMMKIQLELEGFFLYRPWYTPSRNKIEHNVQATLDSLTVLGSPRTILYIKFNLFIFESRMLSYHFFRRLKPLVNFRTVVVEVGPKSATSAEDYNGEMYKRIAQAMEEEMVHTIGPATLTQVDQKHCLEFHPLEHIAGKSRCPGGEDTDGDE